MKFRWSLGTLALVAGAFGLASCGSAAPPASAVAEKGPDNVKTVAAPAKKPTGKPGAAGDWPQFRGPLRDDVSQETGILQEWPENGPALLWKSSELGRGYSGPAVVGDRIYILGTKDKEQEEALCLSLSDGKVIWRTPLGKFYENGWGGGPRSTPTVDEDRVYCLGGVGDLLCLDAKTGKKKWGTNLVSDWGGKVEAWGYSESPLVDETKVVVTPGGKNCIVAFNKFTGKKIWTSTGLEDAAQYASIVRADVGKIPVYLTLTKGGLVGVSARDGEFQFRFEKPGNKVASIPTPIYHDGMAYATSGYGTGCGMVKLAVEGGKVVAAEAYFNKDMINHHGGVILKDGFVFGFSDGKGWVCQKLESGETAWRERDGLGKGSVTYAGGRFVCYSENEGTAVLVEPSAEKWIEHGRFTIPEETKLERGQGKVWTHPVVSHGRLFLRDQDLLFCFDVQAK